jgi:DNA-binding beta-propeller fold protein YncE
LSYNIYWSTTEANATKISGTKIASVTSPYIHTGLINSTPYYYVVTAVTTGGESAESTPTTAIPGTSLIGGSVEGFPLMLSNTVSTLAGVEGRCGSTDGPGLAASFCSPSGATTDGTNLYVTDSYSSTVRKIVTSTGLVTTWAGSAGLTGSTDGIGLVARFYNPAGITTDGTNLYVADTGNNTIRKIVISTGEVSTVAGSAGLSGSTDGTGSAARFNGPSGITTDGTNLYVADKFNSTIRKIVISTGMVTTLAGTAGIQGSSDGTGSAATFYNPHGITTDGTNLYVTDYWNDTIRKIVISTGVVTTLAGSSTPGGCEGTDGTGSAARFCHPTGITTDVTNLYVADGGIGVRKIVISTGVVTTLAGSANFFGPTYGITTDGIVLFVTDGSTVKKIQ